MSEKPPEPPLVMPTVEVAATPSPELIALMRRKAWLKKREEEGEPPPDTGDPQAWRFELAASPSPELVEAMRRMAIELQRRGDADDTSV